MQWQFAVLVSLEKELTLVNREIGRQLEIIAREYARHALPPAFLNDVLDHHFSKPGKFLRAGLSILSAYAVEGRADHEIPGLIGTAAGIELIHAASLVHDDIIDCSEYRRNQPSLHKEYGHATALLIGDILFSQFFTIIASMECLAPLQKERILILFCRTTREMCFGEIWENQFLESGTRPTFPEYIKILKLKTAILMGAGCHCGALLAGADAKTLPAMEQFGIDFGIAYQLIDDYLDRDSLFKDAADPLGESTFFIKEAKTALLKSCGDTGNHWIASLLEFADSLTDFSRKAARH